MNFNAVKRMCGEERACEFSRSNSKIETVNLHASTEKGIINVLYGYLPLGSLLASANKVAATEKNRRAKQLPSFQNLGAVPASGFVSDFVWKHEAIQ